jgi:conjugative transposon TraM protein
MEKSFQMASKYIPNGTTSVNSTTEQTANTVTNTSGKTVVMPVTQFVEQTVSALPQEMSGRDVMLALAQPRNMGFVTATAEISKERKNTIAACVHADQTVMDGESVRFRLLEPMRAGKMFISENTILSGFAKIQGERLQITINSLEYNGSIIPVEMAVYDTDGQRGIFIPDTKEINAAKEIVANMGTNAGTSINLSNDAGEQFVADMGRNVIQGVSQFFSKKLREVKVNLKAGYRVFLLPAGNINNQLASNLNFSNH